jgi:hypothetical protein
MPRRGPTRTHQLSITFVSLRTPPVPDGHTVGCPGHTRAPLLSLMQTTCQFLPDNTSLFSEVAGTGPARQLRLSAGMSFTGDPAPSLGWIRSKGTQMLYHADVGTVCKHSSQVSSRRWFSQRQVTGLHLLGPMPSAAARSRSTVGTRVAHGRQEATRSRRHERPSGIAGSPAMVHSVCQKRLTTICKRPSAASLIQING